jgi:hypothetical protein
MMMAVPLAIFFVALLIVFVLYERLVKRQYQVAREVWEADGRPPGFGWAPPGTSVMRSWTRGKVMGRWIQSTPPWIRQDPTALALQRRMRLAWLIGIVAWLWMVAYALFQSY